MSPAPKRPNTAAATEAVKRRGQETMAAKLREAGWVVTPPERADRRHAGLGLPCDPCAGPCRIDDGQ